MRRLAGLRPLVVVDTIEVGGAGKVALQSIGALVAAGVPVTVANFAYEGRPSRFSAEARERGAEVLELRQAHRLDYGCIAGLLAHVDAAGVNLLESHSFKAHVVAWRLRAARRLPWLAYAHGWTVETLRVRAYNRLERRLLRRPDHVCAPAPPIAALLRAAGRDKPITVLPNGIEASPQAVQEHERKAARRALGLPAEAFVVACIGRLSREKGVDLLVDAVAEARDALRETRVLVVGDGPERPRLEASCERRGLREEVRFLGQLGDVRPVLAAADLLAIPSRSEGLPNVALEALDAGRPILATTVGALPDLVRPGATGWLVAPGSATALACALVGAAATPRLSAMGTLGRALVLPAYSARARLDRLFRLYEDLASVRGTPRGAQVPA